MFKNYTLTIQEALSLGYLYLLILGIISDSIYYRFMGVNILYYSSFLDILISPINQLSFHLVIPVLIIFIVLFLIFLNKRNKVKNPDKEANSLSLLAVVLFMVMSLFLGFGIGKGYKQSELMEKGKLKSDHLVKFHGDTINAKLIGVNSSYMFLVKEGEKKVTVCPVANNLISVQKLD